MFCYYGIGAITIYAYTQMVFAKIPGKREFKIVFTFKASFDLKFILVLTSYLANPNPLHNIIITEITSIS
jgi:hypothetical protein